MTNKTFYITSDFVTKSQSSKTISISGYANTVNKDRSGDIITPQAWSTGIDNFKKNPIMLLQHKPDQPIGRFDKIKIDENGIFVEGTVSEAAERNYGVHTLIKDNVLKSFSVGFIPKKVKYDKATDTTFISELELLEISIVSIPDNQDSLFSMQKSFDNKEDYLSFVKSISEVEILEESIQEAIIEAATDNVYTIDTIVEKELIAVEMPIEVEVTTTESQILVFDAEGNNSDNTLEKKEISLNNSVEDISKIIINDELHGNPTKEKTEMTEQVVEQTSVAAATEINKSVAIVQDPMVTKLVEKTGEAMIREADMEAKGFISSAVAEEVKELRAQLAKQKEELAAVTAGKMHYAENSRTGSQFSEKDLADAYFLAKLLNRPDVFATKTGARMKAVTSVDALTSTFSRNLYEEMEQELVVAPLFMNTTVSGRTFRVPVADEDTDGDVAMFRSGTYATGIADSTNVPVSNQNSIAAVEFTPHKFMAHTHLAKDEEEDTVIPLLAFLRKNAARRLARTIDKSILRGTGALSGFTASPTNTITAGTGYASVIKGITALTGDASLTVNTGSSTDKADPTDIAAARALMGMYGLQSGSDLVYLTSVEGYNNLVNTSDFRTVDKFGPLATYLTGSVGAIYGIPILVSEFLDNVGTTGNHIGTLIYKPKFMIVQNRGMEVESEYDPRRQVTATYMSTRFDFKPLTTVASAALSTRYSLAATVLAG